MTSTDLTRLHNWFSTFCAAYSRDADPEALRNYLLKEEHTRMVCKAAVTIATEVGCSGNDLYLAEAIGLLHDVGRFPQYRQFRTFRDVDSVNHATQSVRTIHTERIISTLNVEERRLIMKSVARHNVYLLPQQLSPREEFFLRLIRDADKLDIWRVFLEYYNLPENDRASAVGLGYPDSPFCSREIFNTIMKGKMINLKDVRTLNDFKLLQLSWLFDLNFIPTLCLFRDKGYLAAFAAILPPVKEVQCALTTIGYYLEQTINAQRNVTQGEPSWIQ